MGFESIIGFVIIVFISSFFNKDKKVSKGSQKPEMNPSERPNNIPNHNERKTTRKGFSGNLEDLFKELKAESDKKFTQNTAKAHKEKEDQNITRQEPAKIKRNSYNKRTLPNKEKTVYSKEIGKEKESLIEFNKKSIVQGIIMSEVLGKPKSLRR